MPRPAGGGWCKTGQSTGAVLARRRVFHVVSFPDYFKLIPTTRSPAVFGQCASGRNFVSCQSSVRVVPAKIAAGRLGFANLPGLQAPSDDVETPGLCQWP